MIEKHLNYDSGANFMGMIIALYYRTIELNKFLAVIKNVNIIINYFFIFYHNHYILL